MDVSCVFVVLLFWRPTVVFLAQFGHVGWGVWVWVFRGWVWFWIYCRGWEGGVCGLLTTGHLVL